MNSPAPIGHNSAGATEFDTLANGVDILLEEAHHWLDGSIVETEADATGLALLDEGLAKLGKELEALRKAEVKPLDEAKAAIQARYNAFNGKSKSGTGSIVLAREALAQSLLPFMQEQQRKRDEAARKAREEAQAAERAAQEAMQARQALEDSERAEALARDAKAAQKAAKAADNASLGVKGEGRAKSLVTRYEPVIDDMTVAIRALYKLDASPFEAAAIEAAKRQFVAGNRSIAGVSANQIDEVRS